MKIVFIAAPYGDFSGYLAIEQNIARAREAAAKLTNLGYGYYCPHLNSAHFEVITPLVSVIHWYVMDHEILTRACDAVLLLAESPGALADAELAIERGIPVYRTIEDLMKGLPV